MTRTATIGTPMRHGNVRDDMRFRIYGDGARFNVQRGFGVWLRNWRQQSFRRLHPAFLRICLLTKVRG